MRPLCFRLVGGCCAALAIFAAAPARGEVINAKLWLNSPNAGNALISNTPAGPADAEFNPAAIDFDSRVTGYSLGDFLHHPTFFNTSAAWALNGGEAATSNNTFYLFTGTTFLNAGANSFVTPHDDGFELSIPGAGFDLQQGGPTAPVDTAYTVNAPAAGLYSFTLSYGEVLGPPGVLRFVVNGAPVGATPVPLPAAAWGGMALLGGLGAARRLRRSPAAAGV